MSARERYPWLNSFLDGWAIFKQSLLGRIGLTLLIIFALMAICSYIPPLINPMYNPMTGVDPDISTCTPPSWRHWLGTDFMGRDIFSQLLAGARVAFMVGVSAAVMSVVLGTAICLTWLEDACESWVPVASLLGVMAIGFVILEKAEAIAHIISQKLKKLWVFAELLLFVLVGSQVNIHVAWEAGLAGSVVIFAGLFFRSIGTYVSLFGTPLDRREKIFCVVAYLPKATVQAAIGALPLAAGVASGQVILAVAVLSILLTAPLGAIGIMILGERILDHGERSLYRFKELREEMGLARVGERVRNKQFDMVWKIIEEKEVWVKGANSPQVVPAVCLRFWKESSNKAPGMGKTLSHSYTQGDASFQRQWEILYDW